MASFSITTVLRVDAPLLPTSAGAAIMEDDNLISGTKEYAVNISLVIKVEPADDGKVIKVEVVLQAPARAESVEQSQDEVAEIGGASNFKVKLD